MHVTVPLHQAGKVTVLVEHLPRASR